MSRIPTLMPIMYQYGTLHQGTDTLWHITPLCLPDTWHGRQNVSILCGRATILSELDQFVRKPSSQIWDVRNPNQRKQPDYDANFTFTYLSKMDNFFVNHKG